MKRLPFVFLRNLRELLNLLTDSNRDSRQKRWGSLLSSPRAVWAMAWDNSLPSCFSQIVSKYCNISKTLGRGSMNTILGVWICVCRSEGQRMRGPFRDTFLYSMAWCYGHAWRYMATSGYVELKELFESHDFQCLDPLLRLNVVLLPGLILNRFGNERSFHFIEVSSEKAL